MSVSDLECRSPMGLGWVSDGSTMGLRWVSDRSPIKIIFSVTPYRANFANIKVQSVKGYNALLKILFKGSTVVDS